MGRGWPLSRRAFVSGSCAASVAAAASGAMAQAQRAPIRFGLTPVFLTSDLALLSDLKAYLEQATQRPVQLVSRRTYQEITALLVSRQLDAAWICGYPYVAYRNDLALVAVPIWQGRTQYQSYLIAHNSQNGQNLAELRGTVHAFSDPDSNSGFLVTRAALVGLGATPSTFFRQSFFTYGHRNVIRAVAAGLAGSGSVDGYVYEVLRETEPDLVKPTHVVSKSEWLGFPPVACPAAEASSEATEKIRNALLDMTSKPSGRSVLSMLRLDGFKVEPPALFDGIAAKMHLVRGRAE